VNTEGVKEAQGQQLISQAREMQILQDRNRISWVYYLGKPYQDVPQEDRWDYRLADPYNAQTTLIFPQFWQLLPTVYTKLFRLDETS
jgi:hypothetical protein